uniref:Uncharacterized protein n=1 Tax=Ascaris lumbricoides TaxID=6252 RepID=A0A0M3IJ79_ASCLU
MHFRALSFIAFFFIVVSFDSSTESSPLTGGWGGSSGAGWSSSPAGSFGGSSASATESSPLTGGWGGSSGAGWSSSLAGSFGGSSASGWGAAFYKAEPRIAFIPKRILASDA